MDDDIGRRKNTPLAPRGTPVRPDERIGRIALPPSLAVWLRTATPRDHESLCAHMARTLCDWGAPAAAVAAGLQRTLDAQERAAPRGIAVDALL